MSKNFFSSAKIFPELKMNESKNSDYISSDSDSYSDSDSDDEKETHICGIAININGKGKFPKLQKMQLNQDDNNSPDWFYESDGLDRFNEEKSECEYIMENNYCLRSYSIASEKDDWNIRLGRCPDYALEWGHDFNQKHWPHGHDYINGYKGTPGRNDFSKDNM